MFQLFDSKLANILKFIHLTHPLHYFIHFYLIPLPSSPRREGGIPFTFNELAPHPWGRGWGEAIF
jgi:hypothetical protein